MELNKSGKVIFIIGYPRSGTSLLRVILDSHPDLSIGPEIKFTEKIIKSYPCDLETFKNISARTISDYNYDEIEVKNIFDSSKNWQSLYENWCVYYARKRNKLYWGEKTPTSYKYLKHLINEFPDAFYLYIVRNPYDVMGSLKKKGWYKGLKSLFAWCYANFNSRLLSTKKKMFIKYEDFVTDPEYFVKLIQNKLGLVEYNLLSQYQNLDHGRIATGDTWNQPIKSSEDTKKKNMLTYKEKLLVGFFCSYYLHKYKYY